MPPLTEAALDDRQLERYLLGLLPEGDAERLDELSLTDDDVAGRLRIVEDDLVDAYVSGELAGELLERFESFYLSSERRRQKVEFARSFLATDRGAGPAGTAGREHTKARPAGPHRISSKESSSFRPWIQSSRSTWSLAAAAALLLFAGGPLLYQVVQLRSGLSEAQRASAELSRRANDLQQQLDDQRAAGSQAATAAVPDNPPPAATRALPTIALVLLPQTRAIGPIATLAVPQQAERLALELRLEPNDFTRYQVALTDPTANQVIWRSERLTSRLADDVQTVSIAIPAGLLKAQHYTLEIDGLGPADSAEVVGSYAFQVVRR
jgi:hypothetical protein